MTHRTLCLRTALNLYNRPPLCRMRGILRDDLEREKVEKKIEIKRTYLKILISPVTGAVPRSRRPPGVQITVP